MHDHKMLHLDLKPANVMRREDNNSMVLIDFGLSKQYDSNGDPESSTSIGLGTPGYAPIEQSNADREKDFAPTLDVYALGATFYKLLTGQTPPRASEVNDEGLPVDILNQKGVSRLSIHAIESAMEPRKSKRIKSVPEFLSLLTNGEDERTDYVTLSLDKTTLSLQEGSYGKLTTTTPAKWNSSNPGVVTVDNNGNVKAISPGTANITASCRGIEAVCKVEVSSRPLKPEPISKVSKSHFSVIIGCIIAFLIFFGIYHFTTIQTDDPQEVTSSSNGIISGHEYVDLGLPSGTLWSTCNVGASSPSDYGSYFAWGETSPKSSYDWENLKYRTEGDSYKNVKFSKYVASRKYGNVDNKTSLEMSDDAARTNWGCSWRMPTEDEWVELRNNCTWEWISQGGYKGYKVTSNNNDNSIFLPAGGRRYGSCRYRTGECGYYWSSSLGIEYSNNASFCFFDSSFVDPSYWDDRYGGRSVRPVSSSSQN